MSCRRSRRPLSKWTPPPDRSSTPAALTRPAPFRSPKAQGYPPPGRAGGETSRRPPSGLRLEADDRRDGVVEGLGGIRAARALDPLGHHHVLRDLLELREPVRLHRDGRLDAARLHDVEVFLVVLLGRIPAD